MERKGLAVLVEGNGSASPPGVVTAMSAKEPMTDEEQRDASLRRIFALSPREGVSDIIGLKDLQSLLGGCSLPRGHPILGKEIGAVHAFKFDSKSVAKQNEEIGRIGPNVVTICKDLSSGCMNLSTETNEVESMSNFSSFRASTCVFKGKWMYEVTLGTAGIQQLGWATVDCPFTSEEGVGDAPDSYSFDGKRGKKWNVSSITYGQAWAPGDVIGVCIDLDKGHISFMRNGEEMGTAFSHVKFGEDKAAYFPACSLSYGERCRLNFGGTPFDYPLDGYRPLQDSPSSSVRSDAHYLTGCLERIMPYLSGKDKQPFSAPMVLMLAAAVVEKLGPFFESEYAMADIIVPWLVDQVKIILDTPAQALFGDENTSSKSASRTSGFERLRNLLRAVFQCCEAAEKVHFVRLFFRICARQCRVLPIETDSSKGPLCYTLLVQTLLRVPGVLDIWYEQKNFAQELESFYTVKMPNNHDLKQRIPKVWCSGLAGDEYDEKAMKHAREMLAANVAETERSYKDLTDMFLDNSIPAGKSTSKGPRAIYIEWLLGLLTRNRGRNRNVVPPGVSDASTLGNLFFVFLHRVAESVRSFDPKVYPTELFLDDSLDVADFPRLGGLVSHLRKESPVSNPPPSGSVESIPLEVRLIDVVILLYHLAPSAAFKKVAIDKVNQEQGATNVEDIQRQIRAASSLRSGHRDHLQRTLDVCRDELHENIRRCEWARVTLFSAAKQSALFELCLFLVRLMQQVSASENTFLYVPEYYLETLLDIFHAVRRGFATISIMEDGRRPGVKEIIAFLVTHFGDSRINNPDLRDVLLQSVSVLLQHKEFVAIFEETEVARENLILSLLKAYDSRFWIPVTGVLLRFWKGEGFAQQTQKKPLTDCSSPVFQDEFSVAVKKDLGVFKAFLNRVFNHLNFTFTEFGLLAKEQQSRSRYDGPDQQRKCHIMFDLSVNLLRILEFVAIRLPSVFLADRVNMQRLVELLLLVINRTTVGQEAKAVDSMLKNGSDKITRAALLAPIAGCLVSLHHAEKEEGFEVNAMEEVAHHPALDTATVNFLKTMEWESAVASTAQPSPDKIDQLRDFVDKVVQENADFLEKQKNEEETEDDGDLCTICYTLSVDTSFIPCKHRSCNSCIKRHLLSNDRCFFCNAEVKEVVKDGDV